MLVMTLSAETSTYTTNVLNLSTGTSSQWPTEAGHRMWAEVLPVTIVDTGGNVGSQFSTHIRPRLYASDDRSHLCWIDPNQDWVVCNIRSDSLRRQSRPY